MKNEYIGLKFPIKTLEIEKLSENPNMENWIKIEEMLKNYRIYKTNFDHQFVFFYYLLNYKKSY